MAKYIVRGADLNHNGTHFAEGATLNAGKTADIGDEDAEILIAKGRLAIAAEEAAPKESAPKKK
ncbi:MAG: hypothetical protein IT565_09590 [Rhodospirillales bacterium]|nr:hypothetical protein [Rhodospirillales bacterium]